MQYANQSLLMKRNLDAYCTFSQLPLAAGIDETYFFSKASTRFNKADIIFACS